MQYFYLISLLSTVPRFTEYIKYGFVVWARRKILYLGIYYSGNGRYLYLAKIHYLFLAIGESGKRERKPTRKIDITLFEKGYLRVKIWVELIQKLKCTHTNSTHIRQLKNKHMFEWISKLKLLSNELLSMFTRCSVCAKDF